MRQRGASTRGIGFADIIANTVKQYGEQVTLPDGTVAYANVTAVGITSVPPWVPEGLVNAANADPIIVDVPPSFLKAVPVENQTLTRQGTVYIIARTYREMIQNQGAMQRMCCYREPQSATATANPDGTRPSFRPPDIPQT
ncbi:MAG TPA: hypothetical protein VN519_06775 [Bryobacteraceae bacterium]|nr:hypothetical protein [Bryobacteraceae bacterium]